MQPIPDMDGRLYFAVLRSLGRPPETLYDLKKIKVLNEFYSSRVPAWQAEEGSLYNTRLFQIDSDGSQEADVDPHPFHVR